MSTSAFHRNSRYEDFNLKSNDLYFSFILFIYGIYILQFKSNEASQSSLQAKIQQLKYAHAFLMYRDDIFSTYVILQLKKKSIINFKKIRSARVDHTSTGELTLLRQ